MIDDTEKLDFARAVPMLYLKRLVLVFTQELEEIVCDNRNAVTIHVLLPCI